VILFSGKNCRMQFLPDIRAENVILPRITEILSILAQPGGGRFAGFIFIGCQLLYSPGFSRRKRPEHQPGRTHGGGVWF
jgi:hypothetical protein